MLAINLGLHLTTRAEKEARYIQYGRFFCCNSTVSYTYYISSQYNVYINAIYMQISKACSIEFLSARTIWQLVYKEDFKCSRLMPRRSLQVVIRQKSVFWIL